jgi:methylglyoxal synthase
MPMKSRAATIALVAHDEMKERLKEWAVVT